MFSAFVRNKDLFAVNTFPYSRQGRGSVIFHLSAPGSIAPPNIRILSSTPGKVFTSELQKFNLITCLMNMSADFRSVSWTRLLIGHMRGTGASDWSIHPCQAMRRWGQEPGVDLVRTWVSRHVSAFTFLWLVNITQYRPLIGRISPISLYCF